MKILDFKEFYTIYHSTLFLFHCVFTLKKAKVKRGIPRSNNKAELHDHLEALTEISKGGSYKKNKLEVQKNMRIAKKEKKKERKIHIYKGNYFDY